MISTNDSTLICTLGGKPQIVTFALDWLLARGEQVREVFAVHLSAEDERVARSLARLAEEFAGDTYRGRPCRFRPVPLRRADGVLTAIRTEAEAETVREIVFRLVTDLKRAGRTLHLCLAGGPRMMGLMVLSAAMLHCGHADRVWHIYTEPDLLAQAGAGAVMHDEVGGRVWLVQVPVVPWGAYLGSLLGAGPAGQTPSEVLARQTAWLDSTERRRCQQVWNDLTRREREVVRAFAEGLTPQQVAERLVISIKTVSSHTTNIFSKCRPVWEIPDGQNLSFHFLREKFRAFLEHSVPPVG
ncbi:MAG: histidine kinase [Chloroflexi bacterium]|nr:MAG: histidine kinase [Chloroflexota bacterium]